VLELPTVTPTTMMVFASRYDGALLQ